MSIELATDMAEGPDQQVYARNFFYAGEGPRVATDARYANQRWFDGEDRGMDGAVQVYRDAKKSKGELGITFSSGGLHGRAGVDLTPAEMRSVAARLLRAADDIEAHPATPEVLA